MNSTATPFHFLYPWRVEARATPFHPWCVIEPRCRTLEHALRIAGESKNRRTRARPQAAWYATRVRTNY